MELKNLRNYKNFKNDFLIEKSYGNNEFILNEELLWDAVKSLFGRLFAKMDKTLADAVNNFTKKIDSSKSWQDSVKSFEESVNISMKRMDELFAASTGPLGIRKAIADSMESVFVSLQVMANKYQYTQINPTNLFNGTPVDKMFDANSAEDFRKNIFNIVNEVLININKTTKSYTDEAAFQKYLTDSTDINVIEQAAPAGSPVTGSTTGISVTGSTTGTTTSGDTSSAAPTGNIATFKEAINKWSDANVYQVCLKKMKEAKPPIANKGGGSSDPFDEISKNSKATGNTQNLAKLLRNIVNITDNTMLAKVRDSIATIQNKDVNKFKEEIGKF